MCTGKQSLRRAVVFLEPVFEYLMNGDALPFGAVVSVDRIKAAQFEYGLCVKGKRIGFEAVDRGDRDASGSSICGRLRSRTAARLHITGVVQYGSKALERPIPGDTASHCLQPQPKPGGDRGRALVTPSTSDQHMRRTQCTCEIMRGEAGPILKAGNAKVGADLRCKPGIRRRRRGPSAFVQPSQDD